MNKKRRGRKRRDTLRTFMKKYRKYERKKLGEKKEPNGLQKPYRLSESLSNMIGITVGCRAQVIKLMWKYVKEHRLQDPTDRRYILPDLTMGMVFGGERLQGFCMGKYMNDHLFPYEFLRDEEEDAEQEEDAPDGSDLHFEEFAGYQELQPAADDLEKVQPASDDPGEVQQAADDPGEVQLAANEPEEVQQAANELGEVQQAVNEPEEVQPAADEPGEVQQAANEPDQGGGQA